MSNLFEEALIKCLQSGDPGVILAIQELSGVIDAGSGGMLSKSMAFLKHEDRFCNACGKKFLPGVETEQIAGDRRNRKHLGTVSAGPLGLRYPHGVEGETVRIQIVEGMTVRVPLAFFTDSYSEDDLHKMRLETQGGTTVRMILRNQYVGTLNQHVTRWAIKTGRLKAPWTKQFLAGKPKMSFTYIGNAKGDLSFDPADWIPRKVGARA